LHSWCSGQLSLPHPRVGEWEAVPDNARY